MSEEKKSLFQVATEATSFPPKQGHDDFTFTDLRKHWDESSKNEIDRRTPQEIQHLDAMNEAFNALRSLGWNNACYCPKDGSRFLAIEAGSTGVFECSYSGDWPDGTYWIYAHGDIWPGNPILYKPMPVAAIQQGSDK